MKKSPVQKMHPIEAFGNAPARAGEIRVENLQDRLAPRVPFPHRHAFYHFIYLISGTGWHEIDFQRFPAKAGQFFIVLPGQVHAWQFGPRTKGIVIEFTQESIGKEILSEIAWSKIKELPACLDPAQAKPLLPLIQTMMQEFSNARGGYRQCLELCLTTLLIQLSREAKIPAQKKPSAKLSAFQDLVEANFKRLHAVEDYAALMGITAKALTVMVKAQLDKSAGNYILDRCLVEAKRLLTYSELSVGDIGATLGFEDPNYFARFFRQRAEVAPGKFRQLAQRTVKA